MESRGFFQFEITMNALVNSFLFILIPMVWSTAIKDMFTLTVRGPTLVVRI